MKMHTHSCIGTSTILAIPKASLIYAVWKRYGIYRKTLHLQQMSAEAGTLEPIHREQTLLGRVTRMSHLTRTLGLKCSYGMV
jgi:hypothetical protein